MAAPELAPGAMTLSLAGRVVLITGAASGIGRATALACGAAGAIVAVNHLARADEAAELVALLHSRGARAQAFEADVTRSADVTRMVADVERELGPIGALLNNAGIIDDRPFLETTEEQWDRMLNADLKSVFLMCRAVLPGMVARDAGVIVNIASDLGVLGREQFAPYCAAKAGVIGLTRSLAREFAPRIRVNAVAPGFIKTDMTTEFVNNPEVAAKILEAVPLKRFGEAADIANITAYLCSEEAGYITGQVFSVDGGMAM